jgi:hypothetical protein
MRYLKFNPPARFSCVRTRFDVTASTEQNKLVWQS